MFSVAIDILHWIAGAVLALVGISYDRVDDCAPAVRQQSFEEARLTDQAAALHLLAAEDFRVEQVRTEDGSLVFVIRASSAQEASGCASSPVRLPSAPAAPVLRL